MVGDQVSAPGLSCPGRGVVYLVVNDLYDHVQLIAIESGYQLSDRLPPRFT